MINIWMLLKWTASINELRFFDADLNILVSSYVYLSQLQTLVLSKLIYPLAMAIEFFENFL